MSATIEAKTSAITALSGFAWMGLQPGDGPLFTMVFVGLVTGTAVAWKREEATRALRHITARKWLLDRLLVLGMVALIGIALPEIPRLFGTTLVVPPRAIGVIVAFLAFGGLDTLIGIERRLGHKLDKELGESGVPAPLSSDMTDAIDQRTTPHE